LRVLVLSFYYQPDLCAGSFRTAALVKELSKQKDIEIDVVSTLPNRYASFSVEAPEVEKTGPITIHRIPLPAHNSGMVDQAKAFFTYYKSAIKISDQANYDLIFATSSRLFTAFLGARIARKKKLPLYLDIRDIFVDTINDLLPSKFSLLAKPVFSLIEKYSFSRAQRINLVSEGFEGYFNKRYPKSELRWFTNGIDDEFLNVKYDSKLKSNKGIASVLYAGNIGEGQGLDEILPKLSKSLKDKASFTVIGDGGRCQQLKDSMLGVSNLSLLPPIDRKQLIQEYKKADILFLHLNDYPAFEKVLPSKIFEYAALGKPILAGVSGYAAAFLNLEVKNCEVFYPGDDAAAKKAFERLSLSDIDRVHFKEKFARGVIMKKMADDIIEFLRNV